MTRSPFDRERARQLLAGKPRYSHRPDATEPTYWREVGPVPLVDVEPQALLTECAREVLRVARVSLPTAPAPLERAPDDIYPAY